MNSEQFNYLKSELFSLTLMGTVQRGKLYKKDSTDTQRMAFRRDLRLELERLAEKYRTLVSERHHLANIERLAKTLSDKHPKALSGKRFRVGSAQKALNLYLKYMWCLGQIPVPPHCPFDARVLARVPGCREVRWTQLDNVGEYEQIVQCAKVAAGNLTLAEWELRLYNASELQEPRQAGC
jgi:hypothetical protein